MVLERLETCFRHFLPRDNLAGGVTLVERPLLGCPKAECAPLRISQTHIFEIALQAKKTLVAHQTRGRRLVSAAIGLNPASFNSYIHILNF